MARSYYWAQQSPINLSKSSSYFVDFPKSPLEIKYQGEYTGSFQEHNERLDFVLDKNQEGNRRPEIVFNCKTAVLKKIHLHMKSEHNLEGKDLDGDIHLLHQTVDSSDDDPEYIVIGIFFELGESKKSSISLESLSAGFARAQSGEDKSTINIDPRSLIASDEKWYWYHGSLTSPEYTENVTWVVLTEPLVATDSDDFKTIKRNASQPERKIYELGRRFLLRNFK